ncbi:IS66 family insertion sequence element accessory protein TnpA [Shewanella algae]|uniref:IS66 family insertion sequence element accessory protein TnpA n=1 Tax=Shewanella algae TaxID=38313 RepID=UPI001AADDFAD|nr:hypothetical protein [Shewanella algae]MBO2660361.1 hypothetical protein [Shewanella algae]HDS1211195.1 hypothetical protein [Shewanella algae]
MSLSAQCWLEHVQAWQQSNQTQAEYCRLHDLKQHQFGYWKRKQQESTSAVQQQVSSGFAVAQFETFTTSHQGLAAILPDGTRLSDINASNVHVAAQLLEVLR